MTHISEATGQFAFFDSQLGRPDWAGKRVLDFGGNVGNILLDPGCRIEPHNYWSIDVSRDAIPEGKRRHPRGHFILYDRYNFAFNPAGQAGLPIPDPGERFDLILGHSVLTHVTRAEALEFTARLLEFLTEGGRAAFSFLDPWWVPPPAWTAAGVRSPGLSNLEERLERRRRDNPGVDVGGLLELARQAELTWTTLVNDDELYFDPDDDGLAADKPPRTYLTLCTPSYMRELFPTGRVLPPVPPQRFHCLILGEPSGRP